MKNLFCPHCGKKHTVGTNETEYVCASCNPTPAEKIIEEPSVPAANSKKDHFDASLSSILKCLLVSFLLCMALTTQKNKAIEWGLRPDLSLFEMLAMSLGALIGVMGFASIGSLLFAAILIFWKCPFAPTFWKGYLILCVAIPVVLLFVKLPF